MKLKLAIVDDDLEMGRVLADVLTPEGYEVKVYGGASEALVDFQKSTPHLLITDHKMKGIDGLMFLRKIKNDYPDIVSIMMTAFGSIETAIDAMKAGAFHYIVKPFQNAELILLVQRAAERFELQKQNQTLRQELKQKFTSDAMVGRSPAMTKLFELVQLMAAASAPVLITGESGSGKELVARALHQAGPRKKQPFLPINCSAIPEQLLESELFGHVKGAFTGAIGDKKGLFEQADGGTLFLDEIGDLGILMQAKLLRVLQDQEIRPVGGTRSKSVDVRIIAATHRDLKAMTKINQFREDLLYRLNVLPVRVPPLRERSEDIPLLVENCLMKFSARNASTVREVTPDAMQVLVSYAWPGNVRELENVMERAMVLTRERVLTRDMLIRSFASETRTSVEDLFVDRPALEVLENRYIQLVLSEVGHDKDEAARILGVSRRTLYRKEKDSIHENIN